MGPGAAKAWLSPSNGEEGGNDDEAGASKGLLPSSWRDPCVGHPVSSREYSCCLPGASVCLEYTTELVLEQGCAESRLLAKATDVTMGERPVE